jgi:hypothetical protein
MSAPGRYLKQKAEIRTTIFGKELHCDLKYIHDYKNQLFVALSVVDAATATSLHMAVLLRSRAPHHVARKLARHWCSLHGSPELLVIDQGGEFDGEFVGWLEAHGIHSKTTGFFGSMALQKGMGPFWEPCAHLSFGSTKRGVPARSKIV